ncbi:hypothetical protein [Actinoplanes sp. M2I2]|uniref:hypothetical protein n=1 Tax=Actinoplanes sp. M2I2 TaxID=1734444 RepID=UPI0020218979|nr:hypothetical protein [Actinoplanes sp. M2I2]
MTYLSAHLTGGLRLISTSAAAYFTSAVLLGIAVVPATLRSYQLFTGTGTAWMELLVELLRATLIIAMIAIGRGWNAPSLFAGNRWRSVGADIAHAVRTGWPAILIELAVVTLVALAVNAVLATLINDGTVRALLDAAHLHAAPAPQTADAITFAIKNLVVIPLYVMATLHSIHAVPPT